MAWFVSPFAALLLLIQKSTIHFPDDVRRLTAHFAGTAGADNVPADVIAPDDKDVAIPGAGQR
jgi:hypothetical protein